MSRYVMLLRYTDKGISQIKDSPQRADAFRELTARYKATVEVQLWTMGAYDGVVVVTVPDDDTMAELALALGSLDFVRSTTLRAFNEDEFKTILGRMP